MLVVTGRFTEGVIATLNQELNIHRQASAAPGTSRPRVWHSGRRSRGRPISSAARSTQPIVICHLSCLFALHHLPLLRLGLSYSASLLLLSLPLCFLPPFGNIGRHVTLTTALSLIRCSWAPIFVSFA